MKNNTKCCLFLLVWLASCTAGNRLEHALKTAENNRLELEKVLDYYKNDPLKYRAAVFLVENMPYHYSYSDTAYLNAYCNELDSVFAVTRNAENELKDSLFRQVKEKYPGDGLVRVSDAMIVTSAFLIDNIERAFALWQNEPWAAHLSFEEFCEYLLPYKICETQILENWRLYFDDFAAIRLDKMAYCKLYQNSVLKACEFVNRAVSASRERPTWRITSWLRYTGQPIPSTGTLKKSISPTDVSPAFSVMYS